MSVQAMTWAIECKCPTPASKLVLMCLANYANKGGEAYPGQQALADDSGLSKRTVVTALSALEEAGFISREHRQRKDGSRTSDIYQLHISKVQDLHDDAETKVQISPIQSAKFAPQYKPNGLSEPVSEPSDTCRFEEFWSVFPKRDGANPKKTARLKFERAIKRGMDPQAIIDGARRLAASHREKGTEGTQFVPMAATWLNQERWDDGCEGPAIDWSRYLDICRRRKQWSVKQLGPPPGEKGCRVPSELLLPGDGQGWENIGNGDQPCQ